MTYKQKENTMKKIYLATKYSNSLEFMRRINYNIAVTAVARLLRHYPDHSIYSPIVHSHPISIKLGVGTSAFWLKQDEWHLGTADELWILKTDDWETSHGIWMEIIYAVARGMPIRMIPT